MTRLQLSRPSALAPLLALAALLTHTHAQATPPAAPGTTSAMAQVQSRGAMAIGSNGSALSFAASSQSASSRVQAGSAQTNRYHGAKLSVSGEVATHSAGVAYSLGNGSGSGWATSAGAVGASAQGRLGPAGANAGGSAATGSSFLIHATRGQGSAVQGSTAAGFETSLNRTVELSTSGHVSGTNARATLAGMNAAGVARIASHGEFSGFGNVGTVTRP